MTNNMKGAGLPQNGRTIVMTETVNMFQEMVNAEALGRNIVGLEFDFPRHIAYLICERATRALPHWPVADNASWAARLKALDALPPAPAAERLTPMEKLAAWFGGRRNLRAGLVQKGGVA